jgi:hypothetical protein
VAALFVALVHFPVTDRNGRIVTSAITSLDLHDIARSSRTYGVSGFFVIHPIPEQRTFAASVIDHWQTGYGRQFDSRRREALDLIRIVTDLEEAIVEIERMEGTRPAIVYTSARSLAETERQREAQPAIVYTSARALAETEREREAPPTNESEAPPRHHPPTLPRGAEVEASPAPASNQPSARSAASVEVATPTSADPSEEPACIVPRTARASYAELRARLERNDTRPVLLLFGTGFGMTPAMLERADLALPPVFGPGAYNHLSVRAAAGIILDRLRGH